MELIWGVSLWLLLQKFIVGSCLYLNHICGLGGSCIYLNHIFVLGGSHLCLNLIYVFLWYFKGL